MAVGYEGEVVEALGVVVSLCLSCTLIRVTHRIYQSTTDNGRVGASEDNSTASCTVLYGV